MNVWLQKEIDEDPSGLTEGCDICGREILHWECIDRSFLDFNGKIRCIWCKSNFVKECVANREFEKIGCTETDFQEKL